MPSCTTPVDHGGDADQIIQNPNILPKRSSFPQVNALPSRTTPVNHGEDAKQIIQNPNILPKCSSFPQVNPEQNIQNPNILPKHHPSFPQGSIEDFDFTHQNNARADGGPPHRGGTACSPPPGGHVHFSPSDIDTSDDMVLGGKITTPCFTDRSRVARAKNTSKFDSAGLAEAKYHIGDMGVDVLTPQIISNCGYQSFHRDHPEDILLCYSEIANIHRVVLQGWTNYWMHFSDPVVEYILKKALPVFPRLNSLAVVDVVKFYDSVQKISMRYLLPLMPFNSICLALGFEGLCPPGMGTIRYAAIALAWMDVLPRILPKDDSEVELVKFLVGYELNIGFDLMWQVMELAVSGFKSTNPAQVPSWTAASDVLSFCREHLLYF